MSRFSPIGVIDSGVGGLSVLREIHRLLPDEDIIYVGDSAWCPYGERAPGEIQQRVSHITDWLLARECKLVTIACNSATIAAVEFLRAHYPIHFVGMEPAVKPAVQLTQSRTIGVLATSVSIAGEKFHRLVANHAHSVRVITRPCPEFVPLVEQGDLDSPRARDIIRAVIAPLLAEGVDVLVLGCTHYPFLKPVIREIAGPGVTLIDSGAPVARRIQSLLGEENLLAPHRGADNPARTRVFTSGDVALWNRLLPTLCPELSLSAEAFPDL